MYILFSWLKTLGLASEAHPTPITPSGFTNDDSFRLLDLPTEVVDRIVNFDEPETLVHGCRYTRH